MKPDWMKPEEFVHEPAAKAPQRTVEEFPGGRDDVQEDRRCTVERKLANDHPIVLHERKLR